MNNVTSTINEIAAILKTFAVPVGGLVLVVIGLLWMFAKDAQKKDAYVGWMVNVFIGFCLVFLGASVVEWFMGKVSKF